MYLDLFFEEDPITELVDGEKADETKRLIGVQPDEIYAVSDLGRYGTSLYHAQVTVSQYKSIVAEDPKLAKTASKLASKALKRIRKRDGSTEDCPIHVFGNSVIDLESKKRYRPDKANDDLTDDEIDEILRSDDVAEVAP